MILHEKKFTLTLLHLGLHNFYVSKVVEEPWKNYYYKLAQYIVAKIVRNQTSVGALANKLLAVGAISGVVGYECWESRSCNFPTDSWKMSDRWNAGAQNCSFCSLNFPQLGDCHAVILHFFGQNFSDKHKIFRQAKQKYGGLPPASPRHDATAPTASVLLSLTLCRRLRCRVRWSFWRRSAERLGRRQAPNSWNASWRRRPVRRHTWRKTRQRTPTPDDKASHRPSVVDAAPGSPWLCRMTPTPPRSLSHYAWCSASHLHRSYEKL